jgi:hypothetical protein
LARRSWQHAAEAEPLLDLAALRLLGGTSPGILILQKELRLFRADPAVSVWLEDAALFAAINNSSPELRALPWWEWPEELRLRSTAAMARMREERRADIDRFCAIQFLFDRQWRRLKAYANAQGVKLVGDMPIYVGGHSADVWVRARERCAVSDVWLAQCFEPLSPRSARRPCPRPPPPPARPTRRCGRWARTAWRAR